MSYEALENTINTAFDARDTISAATTGEYRDAVEEALNLLDSGAARVAISDREVISSEYLR